MFKSFYIFILVLVFSYSLEAQTICSDQVSIYTPNSKPVFSVPLCESRPDWERAALDISWPSQFFGANAIYYFQNILVSNPSSLRTYDCHGFAWIFADYLNPGYKRCLMAGEAENTYMSDDSYIEVTHRIPGAKVYWKNQSHSAVVDSDTTYFISKWDDYGPLVKHLWNQSPYPVYSFTDQEYYIQPSKLPIEGPNSFCGSATFKVPTASGYTYLWSFVSGGSDFSFNGATSQRSVVVNTNTSGKTATLKVTVKNASNVVVASPTLDITSNCPPPPDISGPDAVCSCDGIFVAENFPGTVAWSCSSNLVIKAVNGDTLIVNNKAAFCGPIQRLTPPDSSQENTDDNTRAIKPLCPESTGSVTASVAGTGIVVQKIITATTVCLDDMATYWDYTGSGNKLFTVYLPQSLPTGYETSWSASHYNILCQASGPLYYTFEIDKNITGPQWIKLTTTNVCGSKVTTFDFGSPSPSPPAPVLPSVSVFPNPATGILTVEIDAASDDLYDPAYDIRLYDGQGNLLRQATAKGGTIQFNISNLPNGIYYLHIYDGVSETPEMQQIVVEH